MTSTRRAVVVKMLPGQPLDGTGRVCIHLFVEDAEGTFTEPAVVHPVVADGKQVKQMVQLIPTKGRLACDPNRQVAPVTKNGVTTVTMRTGDHRAVTCGKCMASQFYLKLVSDENARRKETEICHPH